jgi:hypothetical protein
MAGSCPPYMKLPVAAMVSGSQAPQAVAQIGLGLVFFMAKIILRSGKIY